jgi:hypothetical protein
MTMKDSPAVKVALAHIDAWTHHDWDKTRELLAPNVHAIVTTTQPGFGDADLKGVDSYMPPKPKRRASSSPEALRCSRQSGMSAARSLPSPSR